MSSHVYKKVEIVGSSPKSIDDAIHNAIAECNKSIKNLDWFEVTDDVNPINKERIRNIYNKKNNINQGIDFKTVNKKLVVKKEKPFISLSARDKKSFMRTGRKE